MEAVSVNWNVLLDVAVNSHLILDVYHGMNGAMRGFALLDGLGNKQISIISHEFSYGGDEGFFETWENFDSEEPVGWQTEGDVLEKLQKYI